MYYPMFYFDPTYMLVIVGVIICLLASAKMRSTFQKMCIRDRYGSEYVDCPSDVDYVKKYLAEYDQRQ